MNSIDWRLGTMGFSYKDWAGVFYPPGMSPSDYLSFYGLHYNAVELDTTFHAVPPPDRVKRWRDLTPDGFAFTAKVPKQITHGKALDEAREPMVAFLDVMRHFESKLGIILLQFPPSFGFDQIEPLRTFPRSLPTDIRYAVELRDRSWGRGETLQMLREQKACFVSAEYLAWPRRIPLTSEFLYLRWVGEHERFKVLDHEQLDSGPALNWWAEALSGVTGKLSSIWGFFNNDYSGYSPAACNRFKASMNLPIRTPADPAQGRLFL